MPGETTEKYIDGLIKKATEAVFLASGEHVEVSGISNISYPKPEFGDYASNIAMVLAKQLKKNPKDLAENIITEFKKLDSENRFSKIEAAGGFINFTLSTEHLFKTLNSIIEQGDLFGC